MFTVAGDEHPAKNTPNARSSAGILALRIAFIGSAYETSNRYGSRQCTVAQRRAIDANVPEFPHAVFLCQTRRNIKWS
jgi:hypothetical protein